MPTVARGRADRADRRGNAAGRRICLREAPACFCLSARPPRPAHGDRAKRLSNRSAQSIEPAPSSASLSMMWTASNLWVLLTRNLKSRTRHVADVDCRPASWKFDFLSIRERQCRAINLVYRPPRRDECGAERYSLAARQRRRRRFPYFVPVRSARFLNSRRIVSHTGIGPAAIVRRTDQRSGA